MDKLKDIIFNSNFLKLNSYFNLNSNMIDFSKFTVSFNMGIEAESAFNINIDDVIIRNISQEVSNEINKRVMSDIFNTHNFDYINIGYQIDLVPIGVINELIDFILYSGNEYDNIVCSVRLASFLQDCSKFYVNMMYNNLSTGGGSIYPIGRIGKINIWVDPFMKYNDTRIALFNTIYINIIPDQNIYTQAINTFQPSVCIDFKIDFVVIKKKVLYVITDESSETFRKYKSLQRDIKIDKVLNEKK